MHDKGGRQNSKTIRRIPPPGVWIPPSNYSIKF